MSQSFTNQDFTGRGFGSIQVFDGAVAQAVSTTVGGDKITGFTINGDSDQVSPDHTNDEISIDFAGKYMIIFNCSFSAGTGSIVWTAHLHDSGGEISMAAAQRSTSAGQVGAMGFTFILDAADAEVISMFIEHDAGVEKDFTPVDMALTVVRIIKT